MRTTHEQQGQKYDLIQHLYRLGYTYAEIKSLVGVGNDTVKRAVQALGKPNKGRRGYRWLVTYNPAVLKEAARLYKQGDDKAAEQLLRTALRRKQPIAPYTLKTWLTPFL